MMHDALSNPVPRISSLNVTVSSALETHNIVSVIPVTFASLIDTMMTGEIQLS